MKPEMRSKVYVKRISLHVFGASEIYCELVKLHLLLYVSFMKKLQGKLFLFKLHFIGVVLYTTWRFSSLVLFYRFVLETTKWKFLYFSNKHVKCWNSNQGAELGKALIFASFPKVSYFRSEIVKWYHSTHRSL